MTGFDCYETYIALKQHFKSDKYDYYKFNKKIKSSYSNYLTRTDKPFFEKIARKFLNKEEVEEFFTSILLVQSDFWVGDAFTEKYINIHSERKSRIDSLTRVFSDDLGKAGNSLDVLLKSEKGKQPKLMQLVRRQAVSVETMLILNVLYDFFDEWGKYFEDDSLLWPDFRKKSMKYYSLLKNKLNRNLEIYKEIADKWFNGQKTI